MLYAVYRLYEAGRKLNPDYAKLQPPLCGELTVKRRFFNSTDTSLLAQLIAPNGEGLGVLLGAKVLRIEGGSLLIVGTEVKPRRQSQKSSCDYYPQRWLCKLAVSPGQPGQESPAKFGKDWRSASLGGFNPADDD